jgi:hypothetical protein
MKHTVRLSPGRFVNLDTYTKEAQPSSFNMPRKAVETFLIYLMATVGCAVIIGAALGVDITQPNRQVPSPQPGVELPRNGV